jgi:hypothetical protein
MSTENLNEIWQVEVGGQVYEAPFVELGDWINEGSLHPADKVRKGNLRWIEARRVPSLIPFFNAKEKGLPMPVVVNTVDGPVADQPPAIASVVPPDTFPSPVVTPESFSPVVPDSTFSPAPPPAAETVVPVPDPVEHSLATPTESGGLPHDPDFCAIHTDLATVFLCDGCGTGFCKACPRSYGGSVRTCPFCGALCRALSEIKQKQTATVQRVAAVGEGFGATDFFNALAHPFKYKTSLFFGAVMFMAFTLGQSASGLGGIYMMTSAIFCGMLANMLTFGVLANSIDNFSQGNLETNFMPSFEDFELWENVIHPFFLSIGAYISSFGPFFVVLIIGFYFVVSSATSQMDAFQQRVEQIPGTKYYDTKRTLDQSEQVKGVLGEVDQSQEERIDELEDMNAGVYGGEEEPTSRLVETEDGRMVDPETLEQEELWAAAQEGRKQSFESAIGKSPETQAKENEAMLQGFLNLAAPLVVIGGIFFLWGVFYFPAACAVAGYTRSFTATINPIVGIDTIKRMGGTYVKVLLMGSALMLVSLFVGAIVGAILSPFDLPNFGNLPAKAIGGLLGFYLWVVFSCILGYAIYKKSDALQIQT